MFLESSRYYKVRTVQATTRDGRQVTAVALRRLPEVSGEPTIIKGNDRLDLMAESLYADGTRFWRITDANAELWADDLVKEVGRIIGVPNR